MINRPVEIVYSYIADMENYSKWFPGIVVMRSADSFAAGSIGKTYREVALNPWGGLIDIKVEVVATIPNQKLAIQADLKPVLPRFDYELKKIDDHSTQYRWTCHARGRSPLARWIGVPMMKKVMAARLPIALNNLKTLLENAA